MMWLLVTIAVVLLLGMPLSLIVLIPPIRWLGRQSVGARIVVMTIAGLLSLVLAFGFMSWIGASLGYIFGGIDEDSEIWVSAREEIVREMWLRREVPPPVQKACYSERVEVCQLVDRNLASIRPADWWEYVAGRWIYCIPLLTCGFWTWLFTRRKARSVEESPDAC